MDRVPRRQEQTNFRERVRYPVEVCYVYNKLKNLKFKSKSFKSIRDPGRHDGNT